MIARWIKLRLVTGINVLGRSAEKRRPFRLDIVVENISRWIEGRSVVEQQSRLRRETRHQPVPHHPTTSREVEESIARLEIDVQSVLLQMLEQRAARAMDDALGFPRRAGGIHNVKWVVEGHALEGDLACFERR